MRCARGFEAVVRRVVGGGVDGRLRAVRRGVSPRVRDQRVLVCERVIIIHGFMMCFHTIEIGVSL